MKSKLRDEREKAGYSIEHVADKLNIRKHYLLALEEENYHELPGKIYVEGYTKMYYEFLGISLQNQQSTPCQSNALNKQDKAKIESKSNKYIIFCSIILLILVVELYSGLILQN